MMSASPQNKLHSQRQKPRRFSLRNEKPEIIQLCENPASLLSRPRCLQLFLHFNDNLLRLLSYIGMAPQTYDFESGDRKMTRNIRLFMAAALPILAFALTPVAASAQSYTGNWPATVTQSKGSNGTYCIALTDNGSNGWPHSGQATVVEGRNTLYGTFQVIGPLITVTIESYGSYQNAGLVFVAQANNGVIGRGVYDDVYNGQEIDDGVLAFGAKNSCSH
jgi:hypothetical protein